MTCWQPVENRRRASMHPVPGNQSSNTFHSFRLSPRGPQLGIESLQTLSRLGTHLKRFLSLTALICCASFLSAQSQAGSTTGAASSAASPVSRTTKAVHYRAGGSLKTAFQATELLPGSSGEAKIEAKKANVAIDAKFQSVEDATKFGLEYLTYVLWAVSPEGRAVNLGELGLKSGAARVKAITDMQTFGMVVTVEPYFAVTQPGNMVVMENALGSDTLAKIENIDARYELLGRGVYSSSNTKIENAIFGIDRKTPLELFEARNAVRIARVAGADKYAASMMTRADEKLKAAEDTYRQGRDRKSVGTAARDAVETAEEARVMAVKQKAEEDAQAQMAAET